MFKGKSIWSVCIAALLTVVASANTVGGTSLAEGRVFVFGLIVLDFGRKIERFAGLNATLIDCSNERYFCAYGRIVHIVLPKHCSEVDGRRMWSHSGMSLTVLSTFVDSGVAGVHSYPPETVYLLGNPKFRNVVYEYRVRSGVTGIYESPMLDLLAIARRGDISREAARGTFHGLLTLDSFARCS